ncbi:MAG: TRAP transporter substrate-binding protein [Oscillospiraceae bacterium]|nr:TRAP transporter substrate-binding protein [Oscillospiraceae bacterium]
MKNAKWVALLLVFAMCVGMLAGCGGAGDGRRIIRIGHNQNTEHPTHLGLEAFADFINEKLGDKYVVEVYPSELLGSQNEMVALTQTGAIDIVVASNSIMETFSKNYSLFNLPYLFSSAEAYHAAMDDPAVTDPIFLATEDAGFICVTWLDAGTRNFYTVDKPINAPEDLKGLKIRVQQSPTNVRMMELLGGTATPMGFGDVYTALQSQIIDGAENNELALKNNGHGDVCKYYSYDMHQMIPDLVLCNWAFLEDLPADERAIFDEGFKLINTVQRAEWTGAVEVALEHAKNVQGVNFLYPDTAAFQNAVMPLHQETLAANAELQPIYDMIQEYNAQYSAATE